MSDSWPHFYCSDCSNVILRQNDKLLAWAEQNSQILEDIVNSLPQCDCGGSFVANSNPKCPECGFEFKHQNDAVQRLTDPHIILLDGAIRYDESGPRHQVRII